MGLPDVGLGLRVLSEPETLEILKRMKDLKLDKGEHGGNKLVSGTGDMICIASPMF